MLPTPYLLFIGEANDPLGIKMARSVAYWRPELCVGQLAFAQAGTTAGDDIPFVSIEKAVALGAKSFVIGFNNAGGHLPDHYLDIFKAAIRAGLHLINGLHDRLSDKPELVALAEQHQVNLYDIRHPQKRYHTAQGSLRSGKRLMTVGTDCSVGKMYTTLALHREMQAQRIPADFRATGQCGILIAGDGVAVDCVVSDFIAGAVEDLCPANDNQHWDLIEGQGSLFHPAYSGVTLGLLHGAQADALVVCHHWGRETMRGHPDYRLPSLKETIDLSEQLAQRTNPNARVVGISLNTTGLSDEQANIVCQQVAEGLQLPCVDPIRHGVKAIIDKL